MPNFISGPLLNRITYFQYEKTSCGQRTSSEKIAQVRSMRFSCKISFPWFNVSCVYNLEYILCEKSFMVILVYRMYGLSNTASKYVLISPEQLCTKRRFCRINTPLYLSLCHDPIEKKCAVWPKTTWRA